MGNFFADVLLGMMFIIAIFMVCAVSCKIIELCWLCIYNIFAPCFCRRRHREPWSIELCNCLIYCCDYTAYNCSICCINIRERLKKYKEIIDKKVKVKPIIYDDEHIIVVNPYDNYQIGTVSKGIQS